MSKTRKGSKGGKGGKGSKKRTAAKKKSPTKRKNPNRRKGAVKAWKTRRARYGKSGRKGSRRNKRAAAPRKASPAKKGKQSRSGGAKRKAHPNSIAALRRYNAGRGSRGAIKSTLEGGGTSYMQRVRARMNAMAAFSPEAQKARDEAAEMARFS